MLTAKEIKSRLEELESLIRETKQRLPAHSVKPPMMMELLAYEDEYEALLTDLKRISSK
ncbi:MAG: histidine kinase [Desulfobacteraceae bacterium]|jgi:hypothetical protein|nr:MAG: histidine kinase [Desulfobacteraceae bacterium]